MPFQKNNKLGFTSDDPLGKKPVCFKVKPGVKEKLLEIPDWQNKLREFVDQLISGQTESNG
jgi:hypothetical protein